jgi:hypothetical protein
LIDFGKIYMFVYSTYICVSTQYRIGNIQKTTKGIEIIRRDGYERDDGWNSFLVQAYAARGDLHNAWDTIERIKKGNTSIEISHKISKQNNK